LEALNASGVTVPLLSDDKKLVVEIKEEKSSSRRSSRNQNSGNKSRARQPSAPILNGTAVHLHDQKMARELIVEKKCRPPLPPTCPPSIRELMVRCWSHKPDDRPDFNEISNKLEQLEKADVRHQIPFKLV